MRRLKNILLAAALLSGATTLVTTAPAQAASANDFSIAPASTADAQAPRAYFDFDVAPGQVINDKVSIINRTDHNLNLNVYPADAYNVPLDGSFALHLFKERRVDVGAWTKLPIENINVPAKTQSTFPIEIRIPSNARPGDHAGGIVAVNTAQSVQQEGNARVAVNKAVGARVYMRVKGILRPALDVTHLHVGTASLSAWPIEGGKRATVKYELVNTGNVRMDGSAVLSVQDVWGRTVKRFAPRKLTALLPGEKITITERWAHVPALPLRLTPRVAITAGQLSRTRHGGPSYVLPWLLVLLLVLVIAGWRRWRNRNRTVPVRTAPPARPRQRAGV